MFVCLCSFCIYIHARSVCEYICTCFRVCMFCMFVWIYKQTHMHTSQAHTHINIHTYIHTQTYTHTDTAYAHTHTYISHKYFQTIQMNFCIYVYTWWVLYVCEGVCVWYVYSCACMFGVYVPVSMYMFVYIVCIYMCVVIG